MIDDIKEKIIIFTKENKWILLASSFFIGWKFFLISVFFNNDFSKSGESLVYIGHIDSINACSNIIFCNQFITSFENYGGFVHLSYRLFFGSLGHLLNLSSPDVFHLSFYIGIIMLLPALILFLKKITTDKKLIAFLLFFLALYNGGGSHGFWWVVPDFFANLLIFIVYAIILGNYKNWKVLLLLLIPIGFYTHTIFVYLMINLFFFFIIYFFFIQRIDFFMLKKVAFSIFILIIFYIPTSYYIEGNPYGPETFIRRSNIVNSSIKSLKENSLDPLISPSPSESDKNHNSNKKIFPGFQKIKDRYFNWIFFTPETPVFNQTPFNPLTPIFIGIFIYILLVLFYYKQYKILSLYFSALIFTLISSINVHADRSLPFTWPMTFLLYAYGAWFSFELSDEILKSKTAKIIIKIFIYLSIIIFSLINLIYSYGVNQSIYFNPLNF